MAEVAITLKIMPESPETDLNLIKEKAKEIIEKEGKWVKDEIKPIAFGLNELRIIFVLDESKAKELNHIEAKIREIKKVNSVETIDVRRIGF